MADKKISELPDLADIDRAIDYIEVVDSNAGISTKATPNKILGITGNPVGTSDTQTLTNKTIVVANNTISGIANANLSTTAGELGGAWTAWTPTVTGFSGTPTVVARYKVVGKMMTCYLYINGTSNATSFSATLPASAAYGATAPCRIANNGTTPTAPGFVEPSGASVFVYPALTGGTWTASGQKILYPVVFTYEIA